MQTNHPVDYAQVIVTLVRQLPEDRAAQLYAFARFLLAESRDSSDVLAEDDVGVVTDAELMAEDAQWEAALTRHTDTFAALKAEALAEIAAGKSVPMFDERGELSIE